MKYRIKKSAKGWAVQQEMDRCLQGEGVPKWFNRSKWRWHWLASLHVWFLRERARVKGGL